MNVFVAQSQTHSLTNKNIFMLEMFKFDVFSVCHSLDQSVTGIALFIF